MSDTIIERSTLSRLPFMPRPQSDGSHALVFQMPGGRLCLEHDLTPVEPWWRLRGPRVCHSVHTIAFRENFDRELPTCASTFHLTSNVTYRWRIVDPVAAVRADADAPGIREECADLLENEIGDLTREFSFEDVVDAERNAQKAFAGRTIAIGGGVEMSVISIKLRLPESLIPTVEGIERHEIEERLRSKRRRAEADAAAFDQDHDLKLHDQRVAHFLRILAAGDVAAIANMAAANPENAVETLQAITLQSDKNRTLLTETVKVLTESGDTRPGDLDRLLEAAVGNLEGFLAGPQSRLGALPDEEIKQLAGDA